MPAHIQETLTIAIRDGVRYHCDIRRRSVALSGDISLAAIDPDKPSWQILEWRYLTPAASGSQMDNVDLKSRQFVAQELYKTVPQIQRGSNLNRRTLWHLVSDFTSITVIWLST